MTFDYQRDTKQHYKANHVATKYHAAFTEPLRLSTLTFRAVAAGERKIVERYLRRIDSRKIIDIPCGTGKLAPVFARLGCEVICADISQEMLALAKESFARSACTKVHFVQCDAEQASVQISTTSDVLVSLRIMHRVPTTVRRKMLREFASLAEYAVISYGIETKYHRFRRLVRGLLFGGDSSSLCFASIDEVEAELAEDFDILAQDWILPMLSQERIFLLRSRNLKS
jgi:ubiquinone/menaquinone biosynthesis C-methylase UbiE